MSAAFLRHVQNRVTVRGGGGRGRWGGGRQLLAGLVAVLLVVFGVQVAAAPTGAPAAADPTGTGGQFMPVQGRLVDTRTGVGGFTGAVPANTDVVFNVNGQAGLPSTNVAAIAATVTVINTATGSQGGYLYAGANTGGSTGKVYSVLYDAGDITSNTTIIENGDDGKININSVQSVQVIIDVQGYFTTGNGSPAPGGFVPLSAGTVSTITSPAASSTSTVQVTGVAGVPSTATAIYANLTVDNTSGGNGFFTPFPAGTTPPSVSLNYDGASKTAIGTTIDLNAQGQMSIKFDVTVPSSVKIDVLGYFDGQPSNAGFTPVAGRLYDSSVSPNTNIAAGTTVDVPVNGVAGLPAYSASISGVALNVQTVATSGAAGAVTVWPSDQSMPGVSTVTNDGTGQQSNMAIIRPGSDGKVKVRYDAPSGSIKVVLDTQGYFTNVNAVGPASGTNTAASGSRGSQQLASRALNDRTSAAVNPTNGNLLLTQQLLNITGVGPSVNVGVRYNSLNDTRPTLNMGLFESQLFRNSDSTITYTDPRGTAFAFVPNGDGTYNVPKDINAHLTRTVNGSPSASISAGATYELVFHPSQIKNVYRSDGNNLQLIETRDVTGQNKITYNYAGGKLTSLSDTQGRTVSFGYTASPNPTQPTTITDQSLNRTITLAYAGPNGALSQVTAANGQNTTWAYNAAGKVSSITDGSGRRTEFTYDGSQRVSTEKFGANDSAVAGTWTWTYPSTTQTKVTDPNSNATTYDYNATSKQVGKVTDGRGKATSSAFNTHGDLTSSTNAVNSPTANSTIYTVASTNFTYNLTKVTSPTGAGGAAGRFGEATYPTTVTGNGATSDYRPQSLKDAQGNVSNLSYNTWGQTTSEDKGVNPTTGVAANGTWTYRYQGDSVTNSSCGGKAGQICSYTDGNGNTTSFAYNAVGNLTTMTPPSPLGAETYTYDAAGRQKTKVDGNGVTTYTCYDPDDRVFQVSTTSATCGTASGVRTTYDAAGNATGINNTTNSTVQTITFDAQNRATNRSFTGALNASSLVSSATYDRAGRVLTASDGGTGAANTTTYGYDASNNVTSLAEPGGSCTSNPTSKCTTFAYDDNNQRTVTTFPNGVTSTVGYDNSQRWATQTVKNSSGTVLLSRAWAYTSATNVDSALVSSETDNSGNKFTYGYDSANQLKTAVRTSSGGTTLWSGAWTLAKNGNRTQQVINGTTTNYGYNAADQLCWVSPNTSSTCTAPSGGYSLTYDANGNQNGLGYTPFNQMSSYNSEAYSYGGTTNTMRLAASGVAYTPSLISGQTTQHTCSCSTQKIVRDPAGNLIAWEPTGASGASYYYVTDRQNSVLLLTDSGQNKVAEYGYTPYGQTYTNTGTQAGTNPYRYLGAFIDLGTSGLYKLGARYYNESTGRFTQPDPSGQETNRYNYSSSNPVTYSDPSGLNGWDTFLGAVGTIADGVAAATAFIPGLQEVAAGAAVVGGLADGAKLAADATGLGDDNVEADVTSVAIDAVGLGAGAAVGKFADSLSDSTITTVNQGLAVGGAVSGLASATGQYDASW